MHVINQISPGAAVEIGEREPQEPQEPQEPRAAEHTTEYLYL